MRGLEAIVIRVQFPYPQMEQFTKEEGHMKKETFIKEGWYKVVTTQNGDKETYFINPQGLRTKTCLKPFPKNPAIIEFVYTIGKCAVVHRQWLKRNHCVKECINYNNITIVVDLIAKELTIREQ